MAVNVDLHQLERLFKGDRARVEKWIQLYLEEAPALFGRLQDAVRRGGPAELIAAAHELRPQAHYLGSPELLELLTTIGARARAEGASACEDAVREALLLGDAIAGVLRGLLADRPGPEPV